MVNFKKPNEESCLAIKFASKRLKSESKRASEPAQVEQAKRAEFLSQVKQIKAAPLANCAFIVMMRRTMSRRRVRAFQAKPKQTNAASQAKLSQAKRKSKPRISKRASKQASQAELAN